MTTIERVALEALALPAVQRADLAHRLIASLDETIDENVEEAWNIEIQKRLVDIDAGRAKMIPADEVFRNARARLRM